MAQGAGAMCRHGVDRDDEICGRYSSCEFVERDLNIHRIDNAGKSRG